MWFRRWLLLAIGLALGPGRANVFAQELEPRAYTNTPVDMNFVIAGYGLATGGVEFDPSVTLSNAHVTTNGAYLAYVRSVDIAGLSGKIDALVPFAHLSGGADFRGQRYERSVTGLGDPRLRLSVNFYGAPSLTMEQFASYEQDLVIGASVLLSVPLGQYDPEKLLNIGTNRAAARSELGISKSIGPLVLEAMAGITFYTDNDDFFGGGTLSQAPIVSTQAHVIYRFRSGVWAAVDGTYYAGGRTTLNGASASDLQRNSRLGATLSIPVSCLHTLKLYGSAGVSTRTGSDFDVIGLAWQYRWGGGL